MECLSSVKMCTNIINSVYQIWYVTVCTYVHMCSCYTVHYIYIYMCVYVFVCIHQGGTYI